MKINRVLTTYSNKSQHRLSVTHSQCKPLSIIISPLPLPAPPPLHRRAIPDFGDFLGAFGVSGPHRDLVSLVTDVDHGSADCLPGLSEPFSDHQQHLGTERWVAVCE